MYRASVVVILASTSMTACLATAGPVLAFRSTGHLSLGWEASVLADVGQCGGQSYGGITTGQAFPLEDGPFDWFVGVRGVTGLGKWSGDRDYGASQHLYLTGDLALAREDGQTVQLLALAPLFATGPTTTGGDSSWSLSLQFGIRWLGHGIEAYVKPEGGIYERRDCSST